MTVKVMGSPKLIFNDTAGADSLFVTVAATHAGILNGNLRWYRPDYMQATTHLWLPNSVHKAPLPVLLRHNDELDPVGRVMKARYVDLSYKYGDPQLRKTIFYDSGRGRKGLFESVDWIVRNLNDRADYEGLGYIELGLKITDPTTIGKVQRDEYMTVSVGFSTDQAYCSVCHTDWAKDDRCEHRLGRMYDGKRCYLIIGHQTWEEVSWVTFPADPYASVISKKAAVDALTDSLLTRAFYLGLPQKERDLLVMADSLEDREFVLESDIEPIGDYDMDLNAIAKESKGASLTKDRAQELIKELEAFVTNDAAEKRKVRRTLTTLNATIKKNGWDSQDDVVPSKETVEAKIAALDEVLPQLSPEARVTYINRLVDEAAAFGVECEVPNLDEVQDAPAWNLDELPDDDKEFFNRSEDELYEEMWKAVDGEDALTTDAKLSSAQRKKLKSSSFCGPNRSFPVPDCAHVTAAKRLIGRAKVSDATKEKILACVNRKAKRLGCGGSKDEQTAAPATDTQSKQTDQRTGTGLPACLSILSQDDAQKLTDAKSKDKILKVVQELDALYNGFGDDLESYYLLRSCMNALLEKWSAEDYYSYLRKKLENKDEVVVAKSELDTLHDAIEKYESDAKKRTDDMKALLETNKALVADRKRDLATVIVALEVTSGNTVYQGLDTSQLQAEIERKSKRHLISLQDTVTDLLERLPEFKKAALSKKNPDEVVDDVSDDAQVTDQQTPDATVQTDGASEGDDAHAADGTEEFPVITLKDLAFVRKSHAVAQYRKLKATKTE